VSNQIQFRESIKKLRQQKLEDFIQDHISNEKQILESSFVQKYNEIKDSSWPIIQTYNDFYNLPKALITECREHHNFCPDIWFKDIEADAYWHSKTRLETEISSYDSYELDWILQHKEIFQNQNVIDFACHTGHMSFFCLEQGAKKVLGVDVRQSHVDAAKGVQEILKISNEVLEFKVADLHDYSNTARLCQDKDTVLLFGIMYHVHDHVNILNAVLQPSVKHVIIEVGNATSIVDLPEPLIHWKLETTEKHDAGSDSFGKKVIPIGYGNLSWYKYIMAYFDFDLIDHANGIFYNHHSRKKEFEEIRSTYIFKRR